MMKINYRMMSMLKCNEYNFESSASFKTAYFEEKEILLSH